MARKKTTKARGGPGRLSAEDAALLPDRLLDAALELFNERTYAEATMEQIARRAGASTTTLYARYADKTPTRSIRAPSSSAWERGSWKESVPKGLD